MRAPEFVVPVLALPILLYFIFGAPRATEPMPGRHRRHVHDGRLLASTASSTSSSSRSASRLPTSAAVGTCDWSERPPCRRGRTSRAKLALAAVLSTAVVLLIGVAGTLTGAGVPAERWLAVTAALVLGGLAIAPLGFLVGFLARPHGASAIALLILFPLSLASGVFMPVDQLPGIVRDVSTVHAHLPPGRAGQAGGRLRRDRAAGGGRRLATRRGDRGVVPGGLRPGRPELPAHGCPPVRLSIGLR